MILRQLDIVSLLTIMVSLPNVWKSLCKMASSICFILSGTTVSALCPMRELVSTVVCIPDVLLTAFFSPHTTNTKTSSCGQWDTGATWWAIQQWKHNTYPDIYCTCNHYPNQCSQKTIWNSLVSLEHRHTTNGHLHDIIHIHTLSHSNSPWSLTAYDNCYIQ